MATAASRILSLAGDPTEVEFDGLDRPVAISLRLLVALHWLETLAQLIALGVVAYLMHMALPYGWLFGIVGMFALWNLVSLRLIRGEGPADTETQFAVQLVVEILVLAGLLYFTGGATNPFVSLFLVPIAIAAITLRLPLTLLVAGLAVLLYTLLLFFNVPLMAQHMGSHDGFGLHVLGMWINFLISTLVCVAALSFLGAIARNRAARIAHLREQLLQDRQVNALGGLAAAAAHSLSTPLSTVAVILDDLRDSQPQDNDKIDLAREQLELTRERLSQVLDRAQAERLSQGAVCRIDEFLARNLLQWGLLHPDMMVSEQLTSDAPTLVDGSLAHSLTTVLDNAAEANREQGNNRINVRATAAEDICIEIEDEGGGPLPDLKAGSSKADGAGVGLTIAHSNLQRIGGRLEFAMGDKGCIARIYLPQVGTI